MGDVVDFASGMDRDDIDPDTVLDNAKAMGLDSVLVVGWIGIRQVVWVSSTDDAADLLFMLKLAERDILESMN